MKKRPTSLPPRDPVEDFEIKSPTWVLLLCLPVTVGAIVLFLILRYVGDESPLWESIREVSYLLIPLSVVAAVGVYAYIREKLTYADGVYTYRPVFGRTRSVTAEELGSVTIETVYYMTKDGERSRITVYFHDKEQEPLFKIRDDDDKPLSEDPRLLRSLRYHHIKIKRHKN